MCIYSLYDFAWYKIQIALLVIDHLESLDHVCGTVYLLNFVIPPFPLDSFVKR